MIEMEKERQLCIHDEHIAPDPVKAVAERMIERRSSEEVAHEDSVRDRCESAYSWNSGRTTSTQKLPSHSDPGNEGVPGRTLKESLNDISHNIGIRKSP